MERKKKRWIRVGVLFFIIAIPGSFFSYTGTRGSFAADNPTEVSYPIQDFQDGKARFYEYKTAEGIKIKYFILKSPDGVIRAAFDACDVCWRAGQGYKQEGEFMVCRNCGLRFLSTRVNEVKGGCNPAPLARQVVQGRVAIKVADILEGKGYFDFSRRDRK